MTKGPRFDVRTVLRLRDVFTHDRRGPIHSSVVGRCSGLLITTTYSSVAANLEYLGFSLKSRSFPSFRHGYPSLHVSPLVRLTERTRTMHTLHITFRGCRPNFPCPFVVEDAHAFTAYRSFSYVPAVLHHCCVRKRRANVLILYSVRRRRASVLVLYSKQGRRASILVLYTIYNASRGIGTPVRAVRRNVFR
jgi:hypothetical protein